MACADAKPRSGRFKLDTWLKRLVIKTVSYTSRRVGRSPESIRKVLIIRTDNIGDMVNCTPVFRELKRVRPDLQVDLFMSDKNQAVVRYNPHLTRRYCFRRHHYLNNLIQLLRIRRQRYDLIIDLFQNTSVWMIIRFRIIKTGMLIGLCKDLRYNLHNEDLRLYDGFISPELKQHSADRYLEVVDFFGYRPVDRRYEIFLGDFEIAKIEDFLKGYSGRFLILLNPQGGDPRRSLGDEDIEDLAVRLQQKTGAVIIISAVPARRSLLAALVDRIHRPDIVLSCPTDTILEFTALIGRVDLVVTPDTSAVHLASAFNKPMTAIYGNNPDNFTCFAPRSDRFRVVVAPTRKSIAGFNRDEVIDKTLELFNILDLHGGTK